MVASLHEARAQLGDDRADDVNKRAKKVEGCGEKGLEHKGKMI